MFDPTSRYFEGTPCPLGRRGHNRDGKKGKLQVNLGLLCDVGGCPVSASVCAGNIGDPKTLLPEIARLQKRFGLQRVAIAGDRGMIAQTRITELKKLDGVDWITALKSATIQGLIRTRSLDVARFDEVNLFEEFHPDDPGERLVACRNPRRAARRAHTRESLLQATEAERAVIRKSVDGGTLRSAAEIGTRVGQAINRFRMKKHRNYEIGDTAFVYSRNAENIAREAALDGFQVIRTSLRAQDMAADDCVRSDKALTRVERAFGSMKTVSLRVRPIYHRIAQRARAHIFLCMLAYDVERHIREVWRDRLFSDPELEEINRTRDPVAPAERSRRAKRKAAGWLEDGSETRCFRTLIESLETIAGNTCRIRRSQPDANSAPDTFDMGTTPTRSQTKALEMLETIRGQEAQTQPGRSQDVGRKPDFRKCAIDCHVPALARISIRT